MRNHNKLVVPTTSSSSKKQEQQPHLSGAYIRSLVKQLSSSSTTRSRDREQCAMGTKPQAPEEASSQAPQATTPPPQQQQQQPHKKQVRRRLHTSRPYQERLLNMAEARREIVTALKIHRASMRQAKEQEQEQEHQQLQLLQLQQAEQLQALQEQSHAAARASAPMAMAMSYGSFSDYLYNSSPVALAHHLTAAATSYSSPVVPYYSTPDASMAGGCGSASASASGHAYDQLLPLPTQPLGLNLSFQGFNGVVGVGGGDAKNSSNNSSFDPPLLQPSPTSSYSVYSSPSAAAAASHGLHDVPSSAAAAMEENTSLAAAAAAAADASASLHRVLDDDEMAAIYTIGEQHDIEWSDTVNLVTSAWWTRLLESVDGGGAGGGGGTTVGGQQEAGGVDALTCMPDWFDESHGCDQGNKGEGNPDVLGMHLNEYYHHGGYGQDISLPRMDIGEIEGWDMEWFS